MKPSALWRCLLGVALVTLAGCGGAKDEYFRLSASGPATLKPVGLAVGVGPVQLPSYVDRAELVFQNGPNEFAVPAKVHWAGSLADNFAQVLADDLGRGLHSGNVVANPPPGQELRYRVSVTVQQFHAVSGQGAVLEASWRVMAGQGEQALRHDNGSFRADIHGDGYGAVVAAESDLVAQLANAISHSL